MTTATPTMTTTATTTQKTNGCSGRGTIAALILATFITAHQPLAEAQTSPTGFASYDSSVLSKAEMEALQQSFVGQSLRGSMAIIFPDGRPPVTEQKEVKRWIKEEPLLGFSFAGLNADPVGTWALAKEFARANAKQSSGKPVVAVNTGWTDAGMVFGHFYELATIRRALSAKRADTGDFISKEVAGLIKQRMETRPHGRTEQLLIGSHSAGGYYGANVAWLLAGFKSGRRYLRPLRLYSLGLSVNLPAGVKARQLIGTTDTTAMVNSDTAAMASPSTRFVEGVSHNMGKYWDFGDSFSTRRWEVRPTDKVFPTRSSGLLPRGWGLKRQPGALAAKLREVASQTETSARHARKVAKNNQHLFGARQLMSMRLDHDAAMLELKAQRQSALADLLQARQRDDAPGVKAARQRLTSLRQQRSTARRDFHRAVERAGRNMLVDSVQFIGMLASEAVASCTPWRMAQKMSQGISGSIQLGSQWAGIGLNNPMVNPIAAWRSRSSASTQSRTEGRPRFRSRY